MLGSLSANLSGLSLVTKWMPGLVAQKSQKGVAAYFSANMPN